MNEMKRIKKNEYFYLISFLFKRKMKKTNKRRKKSKNNRKQKMNFLYDFCFFFRFF